VNKHTDF